MKNDKRVLDSSPPKLNTMFIFYFLIGTLVASISLYSSQALTQDAEASLPPKVFKIGFEFQMGGNICAGCKRDVKSQPIFSVFKKDRKLWDATVDYPDLEIRTVPFANSEKTLLIECMRSIEQSLGTLKEKCIQRGNITFKDWVLGFEDDSFIRLQRIMEKSGLEIQIDDEDLLTMPLLILSDWVPCFQPQMTIQHHLHSTIPLVLSLYADKHLHEFEAFYTYPRTSTDDVLCNLQENKATLSLILYVLRAFKRQSIFSQISVPKCMQPIDSLLFLQLYTCFSLTHFSLPLVPGEQINAKRCISFMSRRPFSSMWKNIRGLYGKSSYESLYKEYVDSGVPHVFVDAKGQAYEMRKRFQTILYGAHYFVSGERCDFTYLRKFFKGTPKQLDEFLKIGDITTPMIYALDADQVPILTEDGKVASVTIVDIFKNYYQEFLKSIDSPTIRYDFEPRGEENPPCIRQRKTDVDVLSPPYFLQSDSMGAYKDDTQIDLEYGEAIVELRGIRKIGAFALSKMQLPEQLSGAFLSQPLLSVPNQWGEVLREVSLSESVEKLFAFIEGRLGDGDPKAAESASAAL